MMFENGRQYDIALAVSNCGGALTRAQIAHALGLKKHPQLIAEIEKLVTRGVLLRNEMRTNKGAPCFVYSVGMVKYEPTTYITTG